ncbi:hypothetical protein SAMN05216571_11817 [Onishia taeanensis]|jgi:hypothetical protein|uniref:Uncharacterized protein n=1 Tax=Onishia taeanensis TaxID=284577 RepID=A0A1G7V1J2_9GAMM|nr:hypothetical protein [Halomonas taeanensis]MAX34043.1 hypothetical protein [Halomonadaceae bacterium]SDG53438.1 hypothetical protein SAMN05216571_11817 [Halomonas taeanensis]
MTERMRATQALMTRTLALVALTAGLSTPAVALMYNQQGIEAAGHWESMTLVLGEERTYRASNSYDMPGTAFSVDFAPPECRPRLELRVDMGEVASRDETVDADAALRVDRFTAHAGPATLAKERGDNGAYVSFTNAAPYRLLHELNVGDTLRLQIENGSEPWYLAFQLPGAAIALDRAARQCHEAATPDDDAEQPPSAYF